MPKNKNEFIQVQDKSGQTHPDNWTAVLYIEDKGEFRHIVENEAQTLTGIVVEENGSFTFTAGPTSKKSAAKTATGILFNRGSSVQSLKAICASFLVLMSRLRKPKNTPTIQNQTNEGV